MKKFMKAIAFATVMCLVLSTAAFAAVEVTDYATKTVEITVEGAATGEQVAILITKGDAAAYDFAKENILYVDQKASKTFTATITGDVETIDVYAGYASNAGAQAVLVDEDVELTEEEVLQLTITLVDVQIANNITTVDFDGKGSISNADAGTKGAVVYFKINVENGTEGAIEDMIWVFNVKNDETSATAIKYAKGDTAILAALGTVLSGDVEIAAAFESTGYTVDDASAILKVNGETLELVKE